MRSTLQIVSIATLLSLNCKVITSATDEERIQSECKDENGIDFGGTFYYNDDLFKVKKYRCYLKCIYQKRNYIDENGKINKTAIQYSIRRVRSLLAALDRCLEETANLSDVCDRVHMLNFCMNEQVITDHRKKRERIWEECGIENDVVIKEGNGLYYDDPRYKEKKYRCYLSCIFQKWGYIRKDGKIDRNKFQVEYHYVKNLNGTLDRCLEKTELISDICHRVFSLNLCINEQGKPRIQRTINVCKRENDLTTPINIPGRTGLFHNESRFKDYIWCKKCVFGRKWRGVDGIGEINRKILKDVVFDDVENLETILDGCEKSGFTTCLLNECVHSLVVIKEKTKRIREECRIENDVVIKEADILNYDDPRYVEKRLRCYSSCIFQKWGYIRKDGKIDRSKFQVEHHYDKNLNGTLDRCIEETARISDICDRAYMLDVCINEKVERIVKLCEIENDVEIRNNIPGKTGLFYNDPLYDVRRYRCHLKCVFQKWGGIDREHQINRKILKDVFFGDVENLEPILDKCLEEIPNFTDICDRVYLLNSCVYRQVITDDTEKTERIQEECRIENKDFIKEGDVVNYETARRGDFCDRAYTLNFSINEKGKPKEQGIINVMEVCEIKKHVITHFIAGTATGLFYKDTPLFQDKNRCHLKCAFKKVDGRYGIDQINRMKFKDMIFEDVENLEPILDKCLEKTAKLTDICDRVYLLNLCVYSQVITDHREKKERIRKECRIKNDVVIKEGDRLNYSDPRFEEKRFRCYLTCIFQKWDYIDGDGKVNRNNLLQVESDYIVNLNETLDRCIEETARISDICDRTYLLNFCIKEKKWGGGQINRNILKDVVFDDVENLEPNLDKCLEESANVTNICNRVCSLSLCVYIEV